MNLASGNHFDEKIQEYMMVFCFARKWQHLTALVLNSDGYRSLME